MIARLLKSRLLWSFISLVCLFFLIKELIKAPSANKNNQPKASATRVTTKTDPPPKAGPDWNVQLIAAAPKIVHPTLVCTAPDGRVFVAQDPMDMGNPFDKPSDSILCFHPDGKVTTFAENLYAVFGMAYLDGRLYVHHCPLVTVFEDDHGIGRHPHELFTTNPNPTSSSFNDHLPSNMRLAMDGYFYMSTGDKGIYGAVGKDGSKAELRGGGILRFRPDGTELEVYCTGTRNHLDVAVNEEDELFTYDNTDDGNGWETRVTHMVEGGFYGYPYDYKPQRPYTLWMMADFGHGSPTASITYNEDALPSEYRNNLFLSEWGRRQILQLRLKRAGSTFMIDDRVLKEGHDFLREARWEFRPMGLAWSPDGMSMYVADWNFSGWGSPQVLGRFYKVTYTGKSLATPKPNWWVDAASGGNLKVTHDELIAALRHPAQSVRLVAQHRLAERGQQVVPALIALLEDSSAPVQARWHAIWTLDAIDGGTSSRAQIIKHAASGNDLSVRRQAIRQLGTRRAKESISALIPALSDPEASIRFRAATALGRIGEVSVITPIIASLEEPDFFTRFAKFTALNRIGRSHENAWAIIAQGLRKQNASVRTSTRFAMRETYSEQNVNALAALVADENADVETRVEVLSDLAQLHRKQPKWDGKWWGTQPVKGEPEPKTIEWIGTNKVLDVIGEALKDTHLQIRIAAVDAARTARHVDVLPRLHEMFSQENDRAIKRAILLTLGELKDSTAGSILLAIFAEPSQNAELLPDAIRAAGNLTDKSTVEALVKLAFDLKEKESIQLILTSLGETRSLESIPSLLKLLHHPDADICFTAAETLARIGGASAASSVFDLLNDPQPNTKRAAIHAIGLLKFKKALPVLMKFYQESDLRTVTMAALRDIPDISALDLYLEALSDKDETIRDNARRAIQKIAKDALPIIETKHLSHHFGGQVLAELQRAFHRNNVAINGPLFEGEAKPASAEEYAKFATANQGLAKAGRKIFEETVRCNICHAVNGTGGQIGPDLSGIGAKYARSTLIESVLYPSKQIFDGYRSSVITLKNGEVQMGFVRNEKETELTLVDSLAQAHPLRKDQIIKRDESNISLMPEGLQAAMTLSDFADLIAYLESLKQQSIGP